MKSIFTKVLAERVDATKTFFGFSPRTTSLSKEIKKFESQLHAGQCLIYGLQGSGNVVFQHILRGIVGERDLSVPLTALAIQDHWRKVKAFEALAENIGKKTDCGIGYARPWELNGYIINGDDIVIFPQIPSSIVLADTIHGSHAPPDGDDIRRYKASGGKVAVILRHPLDVMTSFATKSVPVDHGDRKAARNELLGSARFVGEFAWQIETFWEHFRAVESDVTVFRYEDLLGSALAMVERLAEFMERDLTDGLAQELAASVGSTELADPGHFFEARSQSWQGSLGEEMLRFFEKVRTLALPYGYDWPSAGGYHAPELSSNFHCCGYSYNVQTMRHYLRSNDLLHELGDLPLICKVDSEMKGRVSDVFYRQTELAQALTARSGPRGA